MNEHQAATKIQSAFRGYRSRQKTNIYGSSQGKEIELYLPLAVKKKNQEMIDYKNMIGGYKYQLCSSDLFAIQIDFMNFSNLRIKIPEIVTAPFRGADAIQSNLPTEQEIDTAVDDLLSIIECFVKKAADNKERVALTLENLITQYNVKNTKHPLVISSRLKSYLAKPETKSLFSGKTTVVQQHQDVEICLVYDPQIEPMFDRADTPRTLTAEQHINNKGYRKGQLLVHIQKTYSLPLEQYNPSFFDINRNPSLNFTQQQIKYLTQARLRAEQLTDKYPLPAQANRERCLGLITLCVEQILTVVHAKEYIGFHEKADFPILSIRQILHYVKNICCSEVEKNWFKTLFRHHLQDVHSILADNKYVPDYRGNSGITSELNPFNQEARYDVIFDLFGDFANASSLTQGDLNNPLSLNELKKLEEYGITSWKNLYENHVAIFGRTHLPMQRVGKEFHPLFEARRIGLMTTQEFRDGCSQIALTINF